MLKKEYEAMFNVEDRHWWHVGMNRIFLTMLRKYLSENALKQQSLKILDAGCGTGKMMEHLSKYGEPVGVDCSEWALAYCQKRGIQNVHNGSILNLPFPDRKFDVVTCFDVLYHLNVQNDDKALSELFRVCKDGGLVLINVPAFEFLKSEHDIAVQTRRRYTKAELKELVEKAGFKIKRIIYLNFFIFPIAFLIRVLERLPFRSFSEKSKLNLRNSIVNSLLKKVLYSEQVLLKVFNFPFGLSVFCIAGKEGDCTRS